MDRRIKIICYFSIITMLLILGGQAYWLFNQYQYNLNNYGKQLTEDCKVLLPKEQIIRGSLNETKDKQKQILVYTYLVINMKQKGKGSNTEGTFTFQKGKRKEKIHIINISSEDASIVINRLSAYSFSRKIMDSLLVSKGYEPGSNYTFYSSHQVFIRPSFYKLNRHTFRVRYSYNPLLTQSVGFDVHIPSVYLLQKMAWQLAGSLLLIIIIAFCLIYQVHTIFVQKRIDSLRHEFMKNMIYEMKQPTSDDNMNEEAIRIGDTEFYYSFNELRNGTERVIITSRQAEILKLLIDTANEVVYRNEILKKIWGDDSYSNSLALNVQITYLRRALKSDAKISIEAVMKKGYILKVIDNNN